MKVVVTGSNGQLGRDLVQFLSEKQFEVIGLNREAMDITEMDSVREVIYNIKPDALIHSAAYTKVDKAESEIHQAYLVNGFGTRNVAKATEEVGGKFCYISTDYVFNGENSQPYHEYDIPNPLGVYGKSKYAGEDFTKSLSSRYFIVRTSWVYGLYGENFVNTMLKLARERDELGVVHDQTGSPTYTIDLAHFLTDLIQSEKYGIYHASNYGSCTWFEFANAIFEEAGLKVKVNPLTTVDFPRPAPRPKYSVLEHISIGANGFNDLRHWREALQDYIKQLQK